MGNGYFGTGGKLFRACDTISFCASTAFQMLLAESELDHLTGTLSIDAVFNPASETGPLLDTIPVRMVPCLPVSMVSLLFAHDKLILSFPL